MNTVSEGSGVQMHGALITFDCEASPATSSAPFIDNASALQRQAGLISKAWIVTDTGDGGFHDFTDRTAADSLGSDLAAGLMAADGSSRTSRSGTTTCSTISAR